MLVALVVAWLVMSGHPKPSAWVLQDVKQTQAKVSRAVTDPQRRAEVLKVIERMKAVDSRQAARAEKVHKQASADAGRRATPSADLVKQFEALDADGRAAANELIDLRFAAKDLMTREEWQAVFGKVEPGKP